MELNLPGGVIPFLIYQYTMINIDRLQREPPEHVSEVETTNQREDSEMLGSEN